ncbi:hypothetical protein V3C99_008249 [Haemonchus contortus]
MATRRRYGTYGRAVTLPAPVLTPGVDWPRPTDMPWNQRLHVAPVAPAAVAVPSVIPQESPSRRIEARMRQRMINERLRAVHVPLAADDGKTSIQELMDRYLNKSKESLNNDMTPPPPSALYADGAEPDEIRRLVNRYCSPNAETRGHDSHPSHVYTIEDPHVNAKVEVPTPKNVYASGDNSQLRGKKSKGQMSSSGRKSGTTSGARMPVGSGSSRSGRLARISQSNIRPFGSGTAGGGYGPGGHPLSGPDPASPTKKDVKHRFEITKKLGSGTYGKVSLAFDHKFDREVAVKLIKKSAIENKADLVRIRREIRIMSALHHPNIIQIFEVFENREKIILVMEYASGGELYDYVSRFGSLPESEARRIFRQITSAVLYCHKHQVAHRDLKLENILLDQDNNAKIADFGLSNYFGTKSLLTTFCGSPLYASPEIINGTPYKGPEVDCWSLGILLYTLVYGSMPFDGRDFNRMVRQIKRGAYYEPDTPSTASMLIRNMLRVNPERRADIFEIASHWWLNLEENMPVIQELPENQITDYTPLTERAETMVVQDLADETDVFMEFGHLSNETRKKIEEFRRRRKQAEEYNENSPVKPPKTARKDGEQAAEMKSEDKSLRGVKELNKEKETDDPLERLRQIENRLGQQRKKSGPGNAPQTASTENENSEQFKSAAQDGSLPTKAAGASQVVEQKRQMSPEQPEDPKPARNEPPVRVPARQGAASRAPSFVPVTNEPETVVTPTKQLAPAPRTPMSAAMYRLEIDSLNMLMNQVLEQMEKGPVSLNLVARIKAHPMYDARPMVKELLESIIGSSSADQPAESLNGSISAAQPENVQRETSKLVQQRSQEVARKNQQRAAFDASKASNASRKSDKLSRSGYGERPWHSVEVGFDPDEESELEASHQMSIASAATDVTVQTTSFEDSDDQAEPPQPPKTPVLAETLKEEDEADSEDEEDYTDSEMEELAEEVEQKIVVEQSDNLPPPDPVVVQPQYLDAFDRGLVKRQSKGKYQHSRVDMYGRGVSMECESPTLPRKPLGGPQPTTEQSPFLFDKAKKIIMQYPGRPDLSELEDGLVKKKKDWLKTQDPDQQGGGSDNSITPTPSCVGSLPPRTPPPMGDEHDEEATHSGGEEGSGASSEKGSSEEESDTEIQYRQPRGSLIGEVRRDGEPKTPTVPPSYFMTVADQSKAMESKPYSRVNGSNMISTQVAIEPNSTTKKAQEMKAGENQTTGALEDSRLYYTNLLYRPSNAKRAWLSHITTTRGKESWESAAAYIRRKNRDRRIRNRTIGSLADEALRDLDRVTEGLYDEPPLSPTSQGRYSPMGPDPFYSHHAAVPSSSLFNYVRPRYHDDSYRRRDERTHSPPNRYSVAAAREELRAYDHLPEQHDFRTAPYGTSDATNYYTSNASSSHSKKFDENQSWASEPRRFEVYKTRAERDAERNTYAPSGAPSYRPASYYSTASDRPLSTFALRKPEDSFSTDAYRSGETYRNRFEENFPFRRTPYEHEKGAISGTEYHAPSSAMVAQEANAPIPNRFRPTARRIFKNDGDRPAYIRTRSMDRKQGFGEDYDYAAQLRNRHTTPEPVADYAYVNYHDTSNGRGGVARDDKGLPRSILKNKQVIDRLRRHLSLEKSTSPPRQAAPQQTNLGGTRAAALNPTSWETRERQAEENPKKKRSILSFNRRRTSEVRMGTDGKLVTNGYDDNSRYKRPSSPIEKIKSLFRKNDNSTTAAAMPSNDYYAGRYSGGIAGDKVYGAYTTTNVAAAREAYTPQYRKYPGSSTRDASTALNRYSYTPGLTDQRRHWYDDHNIY